MMLEEKHFRTLVFVLGVGLVEGSRHWEGSDDYESIEEAIDDLVLALFKEHAESSSFSKVVEAALQEVLDGEDC